MPAGATMNSWMSVESCACLPPLRMLSMGTGSVTPAPRCRYRGTPLEAAGCMGDRQRHAEHCISAHGRLVGRSIGVKEPVVHGRLVVGGEA